MKRAKTENYPEVHFCFTSPVSLKYLSHKYLTEIKIVVKTKLRVNCIFPCLNINIQCFLSKDFESVITFWLTVGFLSCSQKNCSPLADVHRLKVSCAVWINIKIMKCSTSSIIYFFFQNHN